MLRAARGLDAPSARNFGVALPADDTQAYTHDCTVLADSSHGDSHVGSVSPAATSTRTLALTLTLTRTRTLTLALTRTRRGVAILSLIHI